MLEVNPTQQLSIRIQIELSTILPDKTRYMWGVHISN